MKNISQTEESRNSGYRFFEPAEAGALSVLEAGLPNVHSATDENAFLDTFVSAISWVFLYVPGTAAIHFIMMGFSLMFFYGDWPIELVLGWLGGSAIATFMIMLGMRKMNDLRYLRVVAGIVATSGLAAVLYLALAAFMPGDFFGFFAKISLPFSLLIGYLIKRNTDQTDVSNA